ncbi:unnamed protein product [Durusdinium trenchii]|uniref:Uncharacterized protein n=1 Tax=Durusdinium trenchii TaxID=1381693 RepID=A0ABP0T1X4_9DINO
MAPKKRKLPSTRARTQRVVERDVLTERVPDFVRSSRDAAECLCGACLLPIEEEKVGAIDNCTHLFHYECVEKWSQTENSCPQCKVRFFWMAGYGADQRLSLSKVESKDQEEQEEEEFEEISICERCKEAGDEAKLLLCDGMHGTCNATFHYTCVGLSAVPRGSWFCPDCLERGFDVDARGHRGGGRGVRSDVAAVTSVPRAETAVEPNSLSKRKRRRVWWRAWTTATTPGRPMSGLHRLGVDVNPFGSKYQERFGGHAAGQGQRTYTKPSYTLFVTGIPDAESSDSVQSVFEYDDGFLQCRPVGHKSRRMVFVDYDTIEHATKALRAHQGWKWEPVDEGLKIDYDQDARRKRNCALDLGLYEKFWAIGERKPPQESEKEMFARLKAEADLPKTESKISKAHGQASKGRGTGSLGAKIQIKNKEPKETETSAAAPGAATEPAAPSLLVNYSSDSEEEAPETATKRPRAE